MDARQLLSSLLDSARRAEQQTHDELTRLKERRDLTRQHRMDLEAIADALRVEGHED